MTRTQQRRGVVARAPMVDVLARSSTALCAADDDGYEAPKIEFDPDADGARAASDIALSFGQGDNERARRRSVVRFVDAFSLHLFFQRSRRPRSVERLEEWHIHWIGRDRSAAAAVLLRRPAMSRCVEVVPRGPRVAASWGTCGW